VAAAVMLGALPASLASASSGRAPVRAPAIWIFSPAGGPAGTAVTIDGRRLRGATRVAFDGAAASFTVLSNSRISAVLPAGASSGPVSVTTPDGTATSSSSFAITVITPGPSISGFSPASGPAGTIVAIDGGNFTGATTVAFNGSAAAFTVVSDSLISATVPAGATDGPISVTTPNGSATSSGDFTVQAEQPSISGFSPGSGPVGTVVTISGSNLSLADSVTFGGVAASTFTVVSDSELTAVAPAGGQIAITTPDGGADSGSSSFSIVSALLPSISGFSPTSGPAGTMVTISGSSFSGATAVAFAGTAAAYAVDSDSQISATVPAGAGSGPIAVTTPIGSDTSLASFTVATPVATISGFSPDSGRVGAVVTIGGSNLGGAISVEFDGVAADFTVDSGSQIGAAVPVGAGSGPITVTTPAGPAVYLTRTGESPSFTVTPATLHYAVNVGSDIPAAAALGFDLFDVSGSPSNPQAINAVVDALPPGGLALVWAGSLDSGTLGGSCPAPGFTYAQFTAQVDALKDNPRVYGYYVSDEPHPSVCPDAAADIKARADYIHAVAPAQKAFIVVVDGSTSCGGQPGCEYGALAPAYTDVDLVGVDQYPCHYDVNGNPVPCDDTAIVDKFDLAVANGVPAGAIVPVFQAFGQAGRTDGGTVYYRMPSAAELDAIMSTWSGLTSGPEFDYFYSFGVQCSPSSCSAPQAIVNTPDVQPTVAAHNGS
jgi:IPT/TIG domain